MQFSTQAVAADINKFVDRFVAVTGVAPWQRREQDFTLQMKANPLIERYLDEQFSIERSMINALRYRERTGRLPRINSAAIGSLYAFCGVAAQAFQRLSSAGQTAIRQRLIGSLKDNCGLAPFAFEMRTVAHFMAKGFDLEFHDLEQGGYDFLAKGTEAEFEVECKSVSGDLGYRVHLLSS